jgi:hypothetical protein
MGVSKRSETFMGVSKRSEMLQNFARPGAGGQEIFKIPENLSENPAPMTTLRRTGPK